MRYGFSVLLFNVFNNYIERERMRCGCGHRQEVGVVTSLVVPRGIVLMRYGVKRERITFLMFGLSGVSSSAATVHTYTHTLRSLMAERYH